MPSAAQLEWLWALGNAPCEAYIWRPEDWDEIENRLRRPPAVRRLEPRPYDQQPEVVR